MFRRLSAATLFCAASISTAHAAIIERQAQGVQIYHCTQTAGTYAWVLKAPEANLPDPTGKLPIHHFAGPTWQAADGSAIQGKPVAGGTIPEAHAIPWLIIQVATHTGTGLLSDILYVVRSHTTGGTPPATGCDAAHLTSEARIPYTATYTFFGPK
jgi:hypothetical protein